MKAAGDVENMLNLSHVQHWMQETLPGSISQCRGGTSTLERDSSSSRHCSESHRSFHPSPQVLVSGDFSDLLVVRSSAVQAPGTPPGCFLWW